MLGKIVSFIFKNKFDPQRIIEYFHNKNIHITLENIKKRKNRLKIILPNACGTNVKSNVDIYIKELNIIYPKLQIVMIIDDMQNIPQNQQKPTFGKHGDNKLIKRDNIKYIIAIASGKGGVGKSTIALNIARALSRKNLLVGLIDADIHGPSIPVMTGGYANITYENNKIMPIMRDNIKTMSIGFMVDSKKAIIWRGPLVSGAITQMFNDVDWGDIDVMVVDMPPGTGDAQLTLCKNVKPDGVILVSTPQLTAISDMQKAAQMFEQTGINIIGLIENMSGFKTPDTGKEYFIFGKDGVKHFADIFKYYFLGSLPIQMEIPFLTDKGKNFYDDDSMSDVAKKFDGFADYIISKFNNV